MDVNISDFNGPDEVTSTPHWLNFSCEHFRSPFYHCALCSPFLVQLTVAIVVLLPQYTKLALYLTILIQLHRSSERVFSRL